ncbi:hypothetical protein D3C84_1266760 [compost metagenome]
MTGGFVTAKPSFKLQVAGHDIDHPIRHQGRTGIIEMDQLLDTWSIGTQLFDLQKQGSLVNRRGVTGSAA